MPDQRGAPLSVVLTSANRLDKVSAVDLIVSMIRKRPAGRSQEQHLCADKAYDADDLREFAATAGYLAHIKVNPRTKGAPKEPSVRPPSRVRRRFTRRGDGW
jgi:hypothetical protein